MVEPPDALSIVLKEYDTLRAESLQSMGNRSQIISFGIGTVGLLVAATLNVKEPPYSLRAFMFGVAIPVISVLAYWSWFAEFERMVRAGKALQKIESRINNLVKVNALQWEVFLEKRRLVYPYIAVAVLFLGIAAVSPFLMTFSATEQFRLVTSTLQLVDGTHLPGARLAWPLVLIAVGHTGWRFITLDKHRELYTDALTPIDSSGTGTAAAQPAS